MTHGRTALAPGLALALAALAGCSVKPGEYRVYRAAFEPETREADCFTGGSDPSTRDDSSTFFTTDSFAVFAADDDTFFLEFAGLGLTGTRDGTDYSFAGEEVDVEVVNPEPRVKVTTTRSLVIDLELTGEEAYGEYTRVETWTCSDGDAAGDNCEPFEKPRTCTTHGTVFGTWVKDASIDYALGGADEPMTP